MKTPLAIFRRRCAHLLLAGGIASSELLLTTLLKGAETHRPAPELMTFEVIERRWGNLPNDKLRMAADRGDVTAQSLLGWRLLYGRDRSTNHVEGAEWLRKAAEKGFAYAQFQYGWLHEEGRGVSKSRNLAMDWTIRSAEQGFTPAEANLGWLYAHDQVKPGQTVTGNYPEAAEWYTKAANKGHANAQFLLAELYHYGKLGDAQRSNCISWYLKAAAQRHTKAQSAVATLPRYYPKSELLSPQSFLPQLRQAAEKGELDAQLGLARRLRDGDGVAKDPAEAFLWMQRAANNAARNTRVSDAQYELACMFEIGLGTSADVAGANRWFLSAAGESPNAQFRAGRIHEEGMGVPQDFRQAAELYLSAATRGFGDFQELAAERLLKLYLAGNGLPANRDEVERQLKRIGFSSHAPVQYYLGELYLQGKAVAKDVGVAAEHLSRAAKLGFAPAQNRIGELWAAGGQVQPDAAEAAVWFRKAARQGHTVAQFNLGRCFARGEGVEKDPLEAWQWLELAAVQAHPKASSERDAVQKFLTEDQLTMVKARVANFKPMTEATPKLVR